MFDVSFTLDAFPDATPKDICATEIVLQRTTHRLQISLHSAFCNNEKDLFACILDHSRNNTVVPNETKESTINVTAKSL